MFSHELFCHDNSKRKSDPDISPILPLIFTGAKSVKFCPDSRLQSHLRRSSSETCQTSRNLKFALGAQMIALHIDTHVSPTPSLIYTGG